MSPMTARAEAPKVGDGLTTSDRRVGPARPRREETAFFGCRRTLHDPSRVGGGGIDRRVVVRLSPTSISRVLFLPIATTRDITLRPSPGGDHERPTDPTERAPLPLRRHLQRLPAHRRRRRASHRRWL